jgi:hypothetical protein
MNVSNPAVGWLIVALGGVGAIWLLKELGRSLPLQNLLMIAVVLLAGEGLLEWWLSGYVPGIFLWPGLVLAARKWAQSVLSGRRSARYYGVWLILLAALITTIWQTVWQCILPAIVLRFLTTVILLVVLVPWFIQKRPVTTSAPTTK